MKNFLTLTLIFLGQFCLAQDQIPFIDYDEIQENVINYSENDEYDSIIKELNKVNPNDSIYCSSLVTKSYYLLNDKQYDKAISAINEGLTLDCPENTLSFFINKSLCYNLKEDYETSITIIDEAIAIYPQNSKLWYNKALALESLNKLPEAVDAYQKSITLNPTFKSPHLKLGNLCYKQELYAQAYMCYNMYLLLDPDSETSFGVLNSINNVVSSNNSNEKNPEFTISSDDEYFEDIDLILKNRIALNGKYKIPNKINIALIKQNHILLEQLTDFTGGNGFWDNNYVPFFQWINENDLFNDFTYTLTYTIENEKYKKIVRSHEKEIIKFVSAYIENWQEIVGSNPEKSTNNDSQISYVYNGDYVSAKGITKNDELLGLWHFYSEDGQLKAKGTFNKLGKKEGDWEWYYSNGNIKEKTTFKNDEIHGDYLYNHDSGKPSTITTYANGKINGVYKYYNEYGALNHRKTFLNDELEGEYVSYFDVGESMPEFITNYKNGKVQKEVIELYASGATYAKTLFENDERHGIKTKYFFNGKISAEIGFENGELNGNYKTYFLDGQPYEIGQSIDNFYNGPWKKHFADGTLHTAMTYDKGYLQGEYLEYDTDGKLYFSYEYRKGEIIAYKFFDKTGQVLSSNRKKGGEFLYEGYTPDGLLKAKGLYDVKGGKMGPWKFYNRNGVLDEEGEYADNDAIGTHFTYYNNGAIKSETNFEDGLKEGYYKSFYINGEVEEEGWYKNNLAEGVWKRYNINGSLYKTYYFHKDERHGNQIQYGVNNQITSIEIFKYADLISEQTFDSNNELLNTISYESFSTPYVIKTTYNNGNKRSKSTLLNNVLHGAYEFYYIDGKIRTKGSYANGSKNGKWLWYYPNGQVESEFLYENGNRNGLNKNFFENGQVEDEMYYNYGTRINTHISYHSNGAIDTKETYLNDQLHGPRKFFDINNELQLIRYYSFGRLIGYSHLDKEGKELPMIPITNETIKLTAYYQNGQISRQMEFKNGDFVNDYLEYYSNGTLNSKTTYVAGESHGPAKEYYENGQLKIEKTNYYGYLDGLYKEYHENGKLKKEGHYIAGNKHGEHLTYNQNGSLIKKEMYLNDAIQSLETFIK
ncbi:MAG: hypothetical protein BM564_04770 [Bacteroidetes bacterium MedPE-SWsnd-G2]|nr:MAG: hypothetical protein BM564_04770 [Bacteroidetes bacterium MedPE-SWsnd-G2]